MGEIPKANNLSVLVLERIERSILEKVFLPGQALPSEKEMAEEYGVGKSSIREAVKMLQILGVVDCNQGKGTVLRESIGPQILKPLLYDLMLQQSTAEELYEFRLMFDTLSLRIAASKASDEDKQLAKRRFIEYRSLYEANLSSSAADIAFHQTMLEAAKNQFIIKVGMLILELCNPYLESSNYILNEKVIQSHEGLLEIFCTGDVSNIEETVSGSMLVFREVLNSVGRSVQR